MKPGNGAPAAFDVLVDTVVEGGVPFVVHEHEPARTLEDARKLPFDVTRVVKTVAFRAANAGLVLAALQATARVDYAKLAALLGVDRRELASLSPDEVRDLLGIEPGGVSPVPARKDAVVFIDQDVLALLPTLYCGIGRCDRTLEIAPADLVRLTRARVAPFSRAVTAR